MPLSVPHPSVLFPHPCRFAVPHPSSLKQKARPNQGEPFSRCHLTSHPAGRPSCPAAMPRERSIGRTRPASPGFTPFSQATQERIPPAAPLPCTTRQLSKSRRRTYYAPSQSSIIMSSIAPLLTPVNPRSQERQGFSKVIDPWSKCARAHRTQAAEPCRASANPRRGWRNG
jgi:hypothetical protein